MTQRLAGVLKPESPIIRVGFYSLTVNLLLVGAKMSLSLITGSLSLRADAIHSIVDVFGSIALIVGLLISGRKSKSFPYGLYKVENFVAVIIALLLFVTAYEIVHEAISGGATVDLKGYWVIGIVAALILVPFIFSRFEIGRGKKFNSPSLIADGSQFRADVLASSVVFFALLGQHFGVPLDRIGGGIIALLIVVAAWGQLVNSMRVLLDASIDRMKLQKIRSVIEAEHAVSTIVDLTGRNSGRYIFVEATVQVRTTDLQKAHLISQRLENKIKESECCVDRVLIHYEPASKTSIRYIVGLSDAQGQISDRFGESAHFALVDIDLKQKKVQKQEIIANPDLGLGKGKGIKVAQFLLGYKPDVVISGDNLSGKGPGYALADGGAEIVQTKAKSLEELLGQLIAGGVGDS
jgi:cation diffusion facilitator family transporter